MRAQFPSLIVLALAFGAILFATHPSFAEEAGGTPVSAMRLKVERVNATFLAHGTLQDAPRKLFFKESGMVQSFNVEEGQRIDAGQELARLDDSVIATTVAQRRVELHHSETELERAQKLRRRDVVSQTNLDDARNTRDLNRAKLAEAMVHLKQHVLNSPMAGVITRSYFDHPQWITPETPIFALRADDDPWLIDLDVPESAISDLSVGAGAEVEFPALPDLRLPATIRSIAGVPSGAEGFFEVRLKLTESDPRLRAGLRATARLPRSEGAQRGYVVPVRALHDIDGDKAVVYVAHALPGTAERLTVTVALISGERAVLADVPEGFDWVLTDGVYRVRSGDKVTRAKKE